MLRLKLTLLCLIAALAAKAQSYQYRYWFDYGGQVHTVSGPANVHLDIDMSQLPQGGHTLFMQAMDPDGVPSPTVMRYVMSHTASWASDCDGMSCITMIDGKIVSTMPLALSDGKAVYSIDASGMEPGAHLATSILLDKDGVPSSSASDFFVVMPAESEVNSSIVHYEYWINNERTKRISVDVDDVQLPGNILAQLELPSVSKHAGYTRFTTEDGEVHSVPVDTLHLVLCTNTGLPSSLKCAYIDLRELYASVRSLDQLEENGVYSLECDRDFLAVVAEGLMNEGRGTGRHYMTAGDDNRFVILRGAQSYYLYSPTHGLFVPSASTGDEPETALDTPNGAFSIASAKAMRAAAQPDYSTNYDGMSITHGSRRTTAVTITAAGESRQSIAVSQDYDGDCVLDLSSGTRFSCQPGAMLTPTIEYDGRWMHSYVYIDEDANGFFASDDDIDSEHTLKQHKSIDLRSFSCYTQGPNNGTSLNSAGVSVADDNMAMPAFEAPSRPGLYRMRFKIDWDSIDPKGRNSGDNALDANGGVIVDVMLEVLGTPEPAPATFVIASDMTGNYMQIAADNSFVISDSERDVPDAGKLWRIVRMGYEDDSVIEEAKARISIYEGGIATAVQSCEGDEGSVITADAACHDLAGRRVSKPRRGIYITTGKRKAIVK